MKRKKIITAVDGDIKARITIEVTSTHGALTRSENRALFNGLVDAAMGDLTNAPYISASLSTCRLQ